MDLRSEQLALDLKVLVVVRGSNESDFLWAKIGYPSTLSVLTPEAIHTGTSGYVNRCLGGPTPGLASLERPQQVPQR